MQFETISAIATPPGEGGIAIIRISGPNAITIGEKVFTISLTACASHTVHFGNIVNLQGERIDQAIVLLMRAPKSYTGEDTVEIQCHGGSIVSKKVLEAVLAAGARLAQPGEFTYRAFLNGKVDLAQAESVQELIGARSEQAFLHAKRNLEGKLSSKITEFQQRLTGFAAIFEAWVDFPEEGLEFATMEEMIANLDQLLIEMQQLLSTFDEGKKLKEGVRLCIMGPPNAGKSSLMNELLAYDRSIVADRAGTTRDIVEDEMSFQGHVLQLVDTAGIRKTEDEIEGEGIVRAKRAGALADYILLVLDASNPKIDAELIEGISPEKTLVVWNKIDLPAQELPETDFSNVVKISVKRKMGIGELKSKLESLIAKRSGEQVMISSIRHKEALQEAFDHLTVLRSNLLDMVSPEFITFEMRSALKALGRIIGTDITEDILTSIFSTFCIGK